VSKNVPVILPARPPSFLNKASLAAELDVCESTVDELVRRGVLPRPLRLTAGCVRWEWKAVELALASLGGSTEDTEPAIIDPAMEGVKRLAQKLESRRGATSRRA
jgi:predicted DNA-binding transcriptional regulator AlpA